MPWTVCARTRPGAGARRRPRLPPPPRVRGRRTDRSRPRSRRSGCPPSRPPAGQAQFAVQSRLPRMLFETSSLPSGSARTLRSNKTAPFTRLRMNPCQKPSYPSIVTPSSIWLSSIALNVTSNGPPKGPEPPWISRPPLIMAKWICTDAASVAWTPPEIVPVLAGLSSLPRTNVAPCSTSSPPRIVNGRPRGRSRLRERRPCRTFSRQACRRTWSNRASRTPVRMPRAQRPPRPRQGSTLAPSPSRADRPQPLPSERATSSRRVRPFRIAWPAWIGRSVDQAARAVTTAGGRAESSG